MIDRILLDGDSVTFLPTFMGAMVTPLPGFIRGSGPAKHQGRKVCVAGDEHSVTVRGCAYLTPAFPLPGIGTLSIAALAPNQTAVQASSGGKKLLRVGAKFQAKFTVTSPALLPPIGTPDPLPQYLGFGFFVSRNRMFKAS